MTDNQLRDPALTRFSQDIHLLGDLLGSVIKEQHSKSALELVETVRKTAIARRRGELEAAQQLETMISALGLDGMRILTQAFSNYFQLINIAEDQQRIRVLRQRERDDRLGESLADAIEYLHAEGYSAADVKALLEQVRVRLVLTAHPTEAKRKEVLIKLRRIAEHLYQRDVSALLDREISQLEHTLHEEIEELWQTRPTRATKPTVADEVDFSVYFITSALMDAVVNLHRELRGFLESIYPDADWTSIPPILRYASWVGGDRDGNPFVTPEVTINTILTMRTAARDVYLREIEHLIQHVTQATPQADVPETLEHLIKDAPAECIYPGEHYRTAMACIHTRLEAGEEGYATGDDLLADLEAVQTSLNANGSHYAAQGELGKLVEKVRAFGLRLVPLEVREDSRLIAQALDEMFRYYGTHEDYLGLDEEEKQRVLLDELANKRPLFPVEPNFSQETNTIIATWRMIADVHSRFGPKIIDSTIASMCEHPSDVLALLTLAQEVGIEHDVDVVPLFETIDDLNRAPDVMRTLFEMAIYHTHLEARGMRQQIMIGYSDSSKDGGYLASKWGLYTAQKTLAEACKAEGVLLELFHGRGGSIGRGGGPTNRAILAHPPAAMRGPIRITEQGEVIAYRYSNPQIARRHLNQVMNAALLATAMPTAAEVRPEWRSAMDHMAEAGRQAYRDLVYETEGFIDYWMQATPLHELAKMPIGSRPAKRKSGGFEAIRAIPWVFSWTQSRAIIPSWYGVGTGFASLEGESALSTLRLMYAKWPFFNALIDNAQLDLAKADMGIAALYAGLVQDEELREALFTRIVTEHALAKQWVCLITGQADLLDNNPTIKRSIERRNPYVDPLNYIQVALLRRIRADGDDPRLTEAVLATVNGIAAGMKTTG